jgi:hypothetical protein
MSHSEAEEPTTANLPEFVEQALAHTESELGLENVRLSFETAPEALQRAHDGIHEYMYHAAQVIPAIPPHEGGWRRKSAFMLYHWEVFHCAHRSLLDALCAHYNAAFVLLRATMEISIKGAFWQSLSERRLRHEAEVLGNDKRGGRLLGWLEELIRLAPGIQDELEEVSVAIFDKVDPIIEDPDFRPSVRTIVRQLDHWGMFNPLARAEAWVHGHLYRRLSADVHVVPDRTDAGRRLVSDHTELFTRDVMPEALREYAVLLHQVMDLAAVVELNIMRGYAAEHGEVRQKLDARLPTLGELGLELSLAAATTMTDAGK